MHESLIVSTRETVLSLIRKQQDLLIELLKIPELLKEDNEVNQNRTNRIMVQEWQKILINEEAKVNRLEMVLAVVGTMKAGKSTTINTIVGFEILPNRNQPMTTLPTLIRHRPGIREPILLFKNKKPIERMVEQIQKELIKRRDKDSLQDMVLFTEQDGRRLIDEIILGAFSRFQERYEGNEKIFGFLRSLNDLVRLSQDVDVEFPMEDYENVEDLPCIEVEFAHLSDKMHEIKGNLALLDTPGHNEYGRIERLRKIVSRQLARASAVLAVLDYTSLRGQAEGEIRQELKTQTNQVEDRLFIVVNKFDQKDRHGMSAEDIKHHVANGLMEGALPVERIYPVSARLGYLANKALQEIKQNGELPNYKEHSWVGDFGELAMGVDWEDDVQNADQARIGAQKLWKKSRFDAPLNDVVIRAASRASLISIQSATAKMLDFGTKVETFLELRRGALTSNIAEVQDLIRGLEEDISEVNDAEKKAEDVVQNLLDDFLKLAHSQYENSKELLKVALEGYFKEGKQLEKSLLEQKRRELEEALIRERENERQGMNFLQFIFNQSPRRTKRTIYPQSSTDFDPRNPRITFDSRPVAGFFLKKLNEKISSIVNDQSRDLEENLKNLSNGLEKTIADLLAEKVRSILEKAEKRLQGKGFSIKLNVPEQTIEEKGFDIEESLLSKIEESSRTVYRTRRNERKQFFRGDVARWMGKLFGVQEWGYEYEEYEQHESIYVVDITKIQKTVLANLENSIREINQSNITFFSDVIQPLITQYFANLKEYLEEFRGNLKDGIDNHKLDAATKEELMLRITNLQKKVEKHDENIKGVKQGFVE